MNVLLLKFPLLQYLHKIYNAKYYIIKFNLNEIFPCFISGIIILYLHVSGIILYYILPHIYHYIIFLLYFVWFILLWYNLYYINQSITYRNNVRKRKQTSNKRIWVKNNLGILPINSTKMIIAVGLFLTLARQINSRQLTRLSVRLSVGWSWVVM